MKTLLKKIYKLYDQIELGLLSKSEAMERLKDLMYTNNEKYDQGSNEHTNVYNGLIEVNNLIQDTY